MKSTTLALLAGLPAATATVALGIDMDDIPSGCKPICKPIGTLSDRCDVDLKSDIDRDEDRLTNQCICTNKSFDVAKIAALCAACVHQSQNMDKDRGDAKDIDNLLKGCGFASTSYNPTDSAAVASVTVAATAPTDISQLTTTIDGSTSSGVNLATKTQSQITLTGENTSMAATKTGGGGSGSSSGTTPASSTSSAGVATMGANAAYVGAAAAAALAAVVY